MMTAAMASEFAANLGYYMDRVADGESVVISYPPRRNAVLIDELEYNELQRIKNNAEYLTKLAISEEQFRTGKVITKTLAELEAMADE